MDKLITIWSFICRRKYLITVVAFAVIIGFLDENSLFRRLGYEREISQLKECNRYPEIGSCLFVLRTARGGKDYLCTYLRQNHQLYDAYCRW